MVIRNTPGIRNTKQKMSKIVTLSEAALIGLHSMVLIARSGATVNVDKIAENTGSSRHHVAKILQRMVKEGFLESHRGPSGGFFLSRDPRQITLLDIYEAIEGKIRITGCQSGNPVCPFSKCILGNVVTEMTLLFRDHLGSTTLDSML
jgi:Rrf2 family protein